MEKVKISREQAGAIERVKADNFGGITQPNIDTQINKNWQIMPYKSLNELGIKDFLDAIYIGYEVEPEFKVRQWIKSHGGQIGRITRIDEKGTIFSEMSEIIPKENYFRISIPTDEEIATEKQRRFWNGNNRNVWELKVGDVLINKKLSRVNVVMSIREFGRDIKISDAGNAPLIYLKEHYSVLCFAENRKDI